MKELTDQEWTRRLKQDEPQAVQALWELLFAYGVTLARRDRLDDDIGHDAATEAYNRMRRRGVHLFRFECSFHGYCRKFVVNEVYRLMRKRRLTTVELDEEIIGEEDVLPPADPKSIRALIQPCLDRLDPREKDVIELRYYKEHSPARVAERMGITRNYVNVIAKRARDKLRKCLKERGYYSSMDMSFSL